MPYISISMSKTLSDSQRIDLKTQLGQIIEVIGKTEKGLMVDFLDGHPIYLAGDGEDLIVFLEMRVLGKIALEMRQGFVKQVSDLFVRVLGVDESKLYINILEVNQWGTGSFLKVKEE